MPGGFAQGFKEEFAASSSVSVTHNLGREDLFIRVVIGGVTRNDLVTSVVPSSADPTNKLTVALASSQTGIVQVLLADALPVASPTLAERSIIGFSELGSSDEGSSSTTAATWTDKLAWTTAALNGNYVLHFYAEGISGSAGEKGELRVRNITDASSIAAGTIFADVNTLGGHIPIAFAGVAKTFKIQWKADVAGKTMHCRRARLSLRRVG